MEQRHLAHATRQFDVYKEATVFDFASDLRDGPGECDAEKERELPVERRRKGRRYLEEVTNRRAHPDAMERQSANGNWLERSGFRLLHRYFSVDFPDDFGTARRRNQLDQRPTTEPPPKRRQYRNRRPRTPPEDGADRTGAAIHPDAGRPHTVPGGYDESRILRVTFEGAGERRLHERVSLEFRRDH